MLLFPDRSICILTPPKTASTSLHSALSASPFNALTLIGMSMYQGNIDKHTMLIPNEANGYQILAVVRHPLDRLVSLYCHYSRDESSFFGRWSMSFWDFCNRVCRGEQITGLPVDAIYTWPQSRHLRGIKLDGVLKLEQLEADLANFNFHHIKMPRRNRSHRRPWREYYDESTLVLAREWAAEDARQFDYDLSDAAVDVVPVPELTVVAEANADTVQPE